jgi:hypothetical protein
MTTPSTETRYALVTLDDGSTGLSCLTCRNTNIALTSRERHDQWHLDGEPDNEPVS